MNAFKNFSLTVCSVYKSFALQIDSKTHMQSLSLKLINGISFSLGLSGEAWLYVDAIYIDRRVFGFCLSRLVSALHFLFIIGSWFLGVDSDELVNIILVLVSLVAAADPDLLLFFPFRSVSHLAYFFLPNLFSRRC